MSADLQPALMVTNPSGALDMHMLIVLAIMLLAGLLGGAANRFLAERQAESPRQEWIKYSVFGVVAALTVPLFLNMISSSLLEGARTKPLDLFAFGGFCLVYVVASRRLMENVVQRLKGQIDSVRRDVVLIKERQTSDASSPTTENPAPPAEPESIDARDVLSYNDIEILRALMAENTVYGNLASICERTGLNREFVSQRLPVMKAMGVIETRITDKNILHWGVSLSGKAVLGEIVSAREERKSA